MCKIQKKLPEDFKNHFCQYLPPAVGNYNFFILVTQKAFNFALYTKKKCCVVVELHIRGIQSRHFGRDPVAISQSFLVGFVSGEMALNRPATLNM